jgi:hypothetical protein
LLIDIASQTVGHIAAADVCTGGTLEQQQVKPASAVASRIVDVHISIYMFLQL